MRSLIIASLLGLAARAFAGDAVGMNAHVPSSDVVDRIAALGATWMRVDNNWLDHANPCAANIAFIAPLDAAVTRARQKNLNVFMTLAYTPRCASQGGADATTQNDPPDPALWAQYVRKAVAHYRPLGVRHFGLWNEANLSGFWESTAAEYVKRIVVPGVPAVKAGCADAGKNDCLVLGPDLAHLDGYDAFLETTLKMTAAAGLKFDVLTHHSYLGFDRKIWEGDTYANGLDMRRFPFTRRSLLDVLGDSGLAPGGAPSVEVWITETGYHCKPPADPAQMAKQADHYMKVIDAQLARAWYTNTFFYEILDSGDSLDGFGIVRNTGGGNLVNKPAYDALRARIMKEPALSGGPKTQCSDGVDNDGDQRIDLADPGCKDGADNDESDDPPPPPKPRVVAAPAPAVIIDGSLAEWGGAAWTAIASPKDYVSEATPPGDASDLSARFALAWDAGALYLAVEVTDDKQHNAEAAPDLWKGDSVQVAFDVGRNGGKPYDMKDDFEIGWALAGGMQRAHVWQMPPGAATKGGAFAVVRGAKTTYEVRLPSAELGVGGFTGGALLGFSLLVNDSDGAAREGYIQWTSGIGRFKAPAEFGELLLAGGAPQPDAAIADAASATDGASAVDLSVRTGGPDGAASADAAEATPMPGCACRLASPRATSTAPIVFALFALLTRCGARRRRRTDRRC